MKQLLTSYNRLSFNKFLHGDHRTNLLSAVPKIDLIVYESISGYNRQMVRTPCQIERPSISEFEIVDAQTYSL